MERPPEHETVVDPSAPAATRTSRLRIAILVLTFVGSLVLAKVTGLSDRVDVETVRSFMDSMGAWGFLAFLVIFAVGELLHVPGFVFVGAAAIAYGEVLGSAAGYVGAIGSVTASFVVVRMIGGQPLGSVQRPWMRKILARLEQHPVRTIALLRLVFFMAPAVNYALAMTSVRLKDYVIGSALGLLIPIPAMVLLFDWLATHVF
jgi:uncharacterized membrane protein YdjX (TVP38/TMEM64 family)